MTRSFPMGLALLGVGLLPAGAWAQPPQPPREKPKAAVTGTLVFKNDVSFLPGTMIEVEIREVSDTRTRDTTLGKVVIRNAKRVPVTFAVPYDPAAVIAGRTYDVHARVFTNRETLYTSGTGVPVITGGKPVRDVRLTMRGVRDTPGK
jgi:uncharacterized lipoprotein YbaY